MVPSRVNTSKCESGRAGNSSEPGNTPCDCSLSPPASTPITVPSGRCRGWVKMTRASLVRAAISSDTIGLPSCKVRRRLSRSAGSKLAALSRRSSCTLRRNSPSWRATCIASKNWMAGKTCCSSAGNDAGASSICALMPPATWRSSFWLCSILLASKRATTSTSSVCWRCNCCNASSPEARATSQPDKAPTSSTTNAASAAIRHAMAPGQAGAQGVTSTPRTAQPQRCRHRPCHSRPPPRRSKQAS